jgi:hypothetical protein
MDGTAARREAEKILAERCLVGGGEPATVGA